LNSGRNRGRAYQPAVASRGFAPIIGGNAKVLILGSLPSQQSLIQQEYYANPRNTFWRIMSEIVAFGSGNAYQERCKYLVNKGIAVWDVLASSVRPGSLDSAIDIDSARANDFSDLFGRQPGIKLIGFNGMKARDLFDRLVLRTVSLPDGCMLVNLPSTSPAHAAMNYTDKLGHWSVIGQFIGRDDHDESE